MKDTQILSTFQERSSDPVGSARPRPLVFDACKLGVVLRAVLFVEAVVAVAALPFKAAEIVPAEKLPLMSRRTIVLAVLVLVACTQVGAAAPWPAAVEGLAASDHWMVFSELVNKSKSWPDSSEISGQRERRALQGRP